jgi:hypothetical protein
VICAAFLAVTGLSYLYLKNQLYVAGVSKKTLERELRSLIEENHVLDSQIAALTSRTALQQRLKDGFIKMIDIPGQSIVHLHLLPDRIGNRAMAALSRVSASEPSTNGWSEEATMDENSRVSR